MDSVQKPKRPQGRDLSMLPIFAAVFVSFILTIIVSIYSLTLLARENTKEIDTMLTYRIYDYISNSLNEPIIVAKTMACDDFLEDFLENEKNISEEESVRIMERYLGSLKEKLEYDSAFLVSDKTRRYYSYDGLNKIIDPVNDSHDIWYQLFVDENVPYDMDVDNDEVNQGRWTVFVNARIEDADGNLLGVCGVGVQMTNLQEMFLEAEREYDVKINFIDKNGLIQVDTEDINIENAWLTVEALKQDQTEEYTYQSIGFNEFAVSKYVEYLGWYLVVRSEPTSISRDFINVILLNSCLFMLVMGILILTIFVILKISRKERDEREKLLITSERAVAASEAKSSFLSSMSHEIRTPINAVLGMNEMILRESRDEHILEYANNISNAGRTLLSLVNSILDFSKIEEGKMEIVPVTYDTASIINNLVVSVSERAKRKGIDFQVSVDERLPSSMIGDDVRIVQIIMNILTNAIKYTDKGFVKFVIREYKREGINIKLYVAVEDSGIGIRKEDMSKLFESFERLDEVKNHGIEGTGLGMSIVSKLLKLMGSEIHVDSEYGKGSTFSFLLEQVIFDGTPIGDYTKRLSASSKSEVRENINLEKAKILVVDDNDMNLKVAKNLLGLFNIKPELSTSGYDALECVKKDHYHIIFLDHMMPKMDGIETLKRMKEEKLLDNSTKVVALTANAIKGAREKYLTAGFDDYLSKPIDVSQLETVLKKWLPEEILDVENEETTDDGIFEFLPEEFDGSEDEINESSDTESALLSALAETGLNTKNGLRFAGGDFGFYKELVSDYAGAYEKKKSELDNSFKSKDWHEFEVRIHALKSSSKTIGAEELFKKALELEQAAERSDEGFIGDHYNIFTHEYENLIRLIREKV